MENNRYLEAAAIFEGIKEDAGEKYIKAQEKAAESKKLFIAEHLENANKLVPIMVGSLSVRFLIMVE